jgi:L-seryl-tRNA(Ser) seleniumtransferase
MPESSRERDTRPRALPSADELATSVARAQLRERRAQLLARATDDPDLVESARARLRPSLRWVLDASGVIVHANLARAPLAPATRAAVLAAAERLRRSFRKRVMTT